MRALYLQLFIHKNICKGKGKFQPMTGHEGPDVEVQLFSFFNLRTRWGWVIKATPLPFYPRERPGTQCVGGWLGSRAGLEGCGKSHPTPGFDPWTVQSVAQSLYRLSYRGPNNIRTQQNCVLRINVNSPIRFCERLPSSGRREKKVIYIYIVLVHSRLQD